MPPVPEPAVPELPLPELPAQAWQLHLAFEADPVSVRQALAGMLGLPPLAGLAPDARSLAELVLAEVLNNVAEHAYSEGGGRVDVSLGEDAGGVRCLIVDAGREMPGGRLPEGRLPGGPDTALEDLPEGGFGWHLIHTLCVDLTYTRVDGQNRLAFVLPATA